MITATMNDLFLTETDYERLTNFLERFVTIKKEDLEDEIDKAQVLSNPQTPPDLVTMNSRVRYFNKTLGKERIITLVYPPQEDLKQNKISVLSPLGSALLGLRVGQSIQLKIPNGNVRDLKVLEILYQPEASGDWRL